MISTTKPNNNAIADHVTEKENKTTNELFDHIRKSQPSTPSASPELPTDNLDYIDFSCMHVTTTPNYSPRSSFDSGSVVLGDLTE